MVLKILNSDLTTGYIGAATEDRFLVTMGVTIANTSSATTDPALGSLVDFADVTVQGSVYGGVGVKLSGVATDGSGGHWVQIESFGSVTGNAHEAILLSGTYNIVTNAGAITGWETGISMSGDGQKVENSGHITSILANAGSPTGGVYIVGNSAYVSNSGTIDGLGSSINLTGSGEINNSGLLANGLVLDSNSTTGGKIVFDNTGTVHTKGSYAIFAGSSVSGIVVTNSGTMAGSIDFGSGSDGYKAHGSGLVSGIVSGNGGNDFLRGAAAGDNFSGGAGDDFLGGNRGNDKLSGGTGNDEIHGGQDDDILAGNNGNDLLRGGDGQDQLDGGAQRDTLFGGHGDDQLNGGGGNDKLNGGAGDDTLIGSSGNDKLNGGAGNDTMTGGAGADIFILQQQSGHDVVTDFQDGTDRIDLSAFHFASFADLASSISTVGNSATLNLNAAIPYPTDLILVLDSTAPITLTAADFIL